MNGQKISSGYGLMVDASSLWMLDVRGLMVDASRCVDA